MATTTSIYGWPVPELGDSTNVPSDMLNLADAVESTVTTTNATLTTTAANLQSTEDDLHRRPVGDSGNSRARTSDIRCGQSARTDLITRNFTTGDDQWVIFAGKARFDNSGATGGVGLTILVDGVIDDNAQDGPFDIPASGRGRLGVPAFSRFLSAGSHTVIMQADRDTTGVIDAIGSGTINNRNYQPTSLTIIV